MTAVVEASMTREDAERLTERIRIVATTFMEARDKLAVAGHDVVVTGAEMKERAPGLHDGWCRSIHLATGDPFHDPR